MSTLSNEELAQHLFTIARRAPESESSFPPHVLAREVLRLILWNRAQSLRRLVGNASADVFRDYALSEPLSLPPDSWNPGDPLPPLKPRTHEIPGQIP